MATGKNVYDIITERFIEQMKKGVIPWEKPWISLSDDSRVGGWSHTNGKSYSLINQMMLPSEGEYLTYHQIQQEGGRLKKGSKGFPIVFWKSFEVESKDAETNLIKKSQVPVLRYYTVFSIEDCEGIEQKFFKDESKLEGLTEPSRCKLADSIVEKYLGESGITLKHIAGDAAYYSTRDDLVVLPLKKQFKKKAEYYSTLFHELIHSTGHQDRLNRFGAGAMIARGRSYALEELVAEIGACSMNYLCGLETKDSIMNSNAYLQSWIQALLNDTHMIVKAASRAQNAVRYIFADGEDEVAAIRPCNDKKEQDYSEPPVDEMDNGGCPF